MFKSNSEQRWFVVAVLPFTILYVYTFIALVVDAQVDCNNCGNNCNGCRVQFPDPPPIILQPPAPPPNNTCCCDCGGTGSNCGCGNNCGCCCGGNNYGATDCCMPSASPINQNMQLVNNQAPQLVNNQAPQQTGPISRTNRCCQVQYCCCNGGSNGCGSGGCGSCCGGNNCCCQQNCCQQNCCQQNCCQQSCCQPCCCGGGCNCGCQCCQPCGCTSCCCNPCSCYDCCNDCYPNDYDCEIGYRKRRRRRRQATPTPTFHRMRHEGPPTHSIPTAGPFQRRFYVLPLPLPSEPTAEEMEMRNHRTKHHHFHHHFFHGFPSCSCCKCCNGCGNFNAPPEANWNTGGYSNDPNSQSMNNNQPVHFNRHFAARPPCIDCNMNPGIGYPDACCPTVTGYQNGYFERFHRRRRRQSFVPPAIYAASASDKVLNFLIPMFYKPPGSGRSATPPIFSNPCPNSHQNIRSCGCSNTPRQQPGPSSSPPFYRSPCATHFNEQSPFAQQSAQANKRKCGCQCCKCQTQKKRKKRRR